MKRTVRITTLAGVAMSALAVGSAQAGTPPLAANLYKHYCRGRWLGRAGGGGGAGCNPPTRGRAPPPPPQGRGCR
jgi:hypothetical protein